MMQFKRGNTFDFTGEVEVTSPKTDGAVDLTGWTARSEIRDIGGARIAELVVEIVDGPARLIRMYADAETADWPLGCARVDIMFTSPAPDLVRVSTDTSEFEIIEGPTRADEA